MNAACHIRMRHDASRPHTWQDNDTILTVYEQVLSHVQMSDVTYEPVMSRTW